jgi:hypothetical protein
MLKVPQCTLELARFNALYTGLKHHIYKGGDIYSIIPDGYTVPASLLKCCTVDREGNDDCTQTDEHTIP